MATRSPKMTPRWPQDGQGWPISARRRPQNGPKVAKGGTKIAPSRPQMVPRWPQDGLKTGQVVLRMAQDVGYGWEVGNKRKI